MQNTGVHYSIHPLGPYKWTYTFIKWGQRALLQPAHPLSSLWSGLIWIESISWGGATLCPAKCVGRNIKRRSVYYSLQHFHLLTSYSSVQIWQCSVMCHYTVVWRNKSWYFHIAFPAVWPGWGIFLFAWPWNPYLCDCDYVLELRRIFPSFWDINNYTGLAGAGREEILDHYRSANIQTKTSYIIHQAKHQSFVMVYNRTEWTHLRFPYSDHLFKLSRLALSEALIAKLSVVFTAWVMNYEGLTWQQKFLCL